MFVFDKYQHKNMLILYDAVGALADAVGSTLQNPMYVKILMPLLLKCWSKLIPSVRQADLRAVSNNRAHISAPVSGIPTKSRDGRA